MTDYVTTYQRIKSSYANLLNIIESYPKDKTDEAGALGVWSPKQIVAHLSGWVVEANQRYQDILQGKMDEKTYPDWDVFNAASTEARAHLSWSQTLTDLKQSVDLWFAEVEKVSAIWVARDNRFLEWLTALDNEFRHHAVDLSKFIEDISAVYPILEFDSDPKGMVEPSTLYPKHPDMPEHVVVCFFREVLMQLRMRFPMTVIRQLGGESGDNPVYRMMIDDKPIALLHPGVGAPLACSFLEETIALGGRKFIACGGAGVLASDIPVGGIIIPESAVRDEGTSYHYLPPSREVKGNQHAINVLKTVLADHNIPHHVGKTWTTDVMYRETRKKVNARKAEGCLTVEMETSAFFAVANFRDVIFGQLLYGGDDVGGEHWDGRDWTGQTSTREKLFWLAAEAVLKL